MRRSRSILFLYAALTCCCAAAMSDDSRPASGRVAPAPADRQPPVDPKRVQPESLPQGFILVVTDKASAATSDSPIYLASNHNGWNPADPAQRLTPRSDRRWQIVLPKPKLDSRMAFKFTRGSWDNVEVDAKFNDVENRSLPMVDASKLASDERPIIELTIESFRDKRPWEPGLAAADPYREIKASGTIRRVEVVGGGVPLTRDLLVWLPPGYSDTANAQRRYPVLYLQDGQNVFEKLPTAPGEWEADETATRLIAEGEIEPIIIVGIPNGGAVRIQEYLPVEVFNVASPRGEAYVDFLIREVVPRVERAFRVKAGPENTAIGGSSLGATISLYAAAKHPDIFGKVLVESEPVFAESEKFRSLLESEARRLHRVYIGVGGHEIEKEPAGSPANEKYVQSARDLDALLKRKGLADPDRKLVIDPDATHTESAWAKRLPIALKFLFPPRKD